MCFSDLNFWTLSHKLKTLHQSQTSKVVFIVLKIRPPGGKVNVQEEEEDMDKEEEKGEEDGEELNQNRTKGEGQDEEG